LAATLFSRLNFEANEAFILHKGRDVVRVSATH